MSDYPQKNQNANNNLKPELSENFPQKKNIMYKIFDVNKKQQTILSNSSFDLGKSLHFHSSKIKNHQSNYMGFDEGFNRKYNVKRNYQQFGEESENDGIKTPLTKKKNSNNIFQRDSFNPSDQMITNNNKNALSYILNNPSELELSQINSQLPVLSIHK